MNQVDYRFATSSDAPLLASLNQQLIRDEGHRNPMGLDQLTERMDDWLKNEYKAVLFETPTAAIGYALFRSEPEFVYLRQLFVISELRRQGIARNALGWLWKNAWTDAPRVRIEVLVSNVIGIGFWKSVDFQMYAITMEASPPTNG